MSKAENALALDSRELFILGLDNGWSNRTADDAIEESAKRQANEIIRRRAADKNDLPIIAYPFVPAINLPALSKYLDCLDKHLLRVGIRIPRPQL